jgi:hypothetical protein
MTTLALAAYLLLQGLPQPFPAPMERRLVHIESRAVCAAGLRLRQPGAEG